MEWGERVNRLSIHSLSLSNNPGLLWQPLYACSLITLTLYTYSLIHTHSEKRHKKTAHTSWADNPLPPSMHTNTVNSHPVRYLPLIQQMQSGLAWATLTAGTRSFLTSLMARWSLILARLCVSSTVIRTWRSSLRCSQLGLPRFISSWSTQRLEKKKGWFVWMHLTNSGLFTAERGERNRISLFFCFGWDLGPPSDSTQTDLHKAQGYLTPFRRRIEIMEWPCCSAAVKQDCCCILLKVVFSGFLCTVSQDGAFF